MGIYDRDYFRDDEPQGFSLGGQWSAVGTIVFLNVIVYLFAAFTAEPGPWPGSQISPVNNALALSSNLFGELYWALSHSHYWEAWRLVTLVTNGFAHDVNGIWHVLFNMFMLWVLGRDIEGIYGKRLFWQLYMSLVVLASLGWMLLTNLVSPNPGTVIGASGAVMGVFLLFVLHFPKRTILLFFVLPVPVWLLGVLWIGKDLIGFNADAVGVISSTTAYGAHLAGAFWGFVFYRWHWTLFSILPMHWLPKLSVKRRKGPKLRVVHEEPEEDDAPDEREVDRILAKISRLGTDSLTDEEHETLEAASRRLQKRRGVRMD